MPARSEQQRKWAFAVKGEKWARAHHFDNKGKLPKHATRATSRSTGTKQEDMVRQFMKRKKRRGKARGN